MISRPMLLVFLLLVLIITSQFEWKQPLVSEIEAASGVSHKEQLISKREEAVKEKIILSQEKNIHKLQDIIQSLEQQLWQCRCSNLTTMTNSSASPVRERVIEVERLQILEDSS